MILEKYKINSCFKKCIQIFYYSLIFSANSKYTLILIIQLNNAINNKNNGLN